MTYEIEITLNCQQLYDAIERRLMRYGVAKEDLDGVWDEIAGCHANDQRYRWARKQRNSDGDGNPEYAFSFHQIKFRYAVDTNRKRIIINRVDF